MSLWQSNMETASFSSTIPPAIFPCTKQGLSSQKCRISEGSVFQFHIMGTGQNLFFPWFGALLIHIHYITIYNQLWLRDLVWAPGFWLSSPHRNFASSDSRPAAKLLAKQYLSNLAVVPWVLQNIFHGIERGVWWGRRIWACHLSSW